MTTRRNTHTFAVLLYVACIIFLLWAMFGLIIWGLFPNAGISPAKLGDSFGGFTALFTALSLIGIGFNLYYQRTDTQTQIEMLYQQLQEAKQSKGALANQVLETRRSARIIALQSKLAFFSQPNIAGSANIQHAVSNALYDHDHVAEIKRLISEIDDEIAYRGNRIIEVEMDKFSVCHIRCNGVVNAGLEVTVIDIKNYSVLVRLDLAHGYQFEKFQATAFEPIEIFCHGEFGVGARVKINQTSRISTYGTDLYFTVSMGWGLLPESKKYEVDFTVSNAFADGFRDQ